MSNITDNNITESGTQRVKLSLKQKLHLGTDARALVEAGYYNSDLTLVSRKHFIMNVLLPKFEKEYAELARAELAQLDAEEKQNKRK
ncbi:MAG: hypothetical protein PHE73_08905 [Sulfurovaceae bacterium]|nr:hypothetical protein [Sulfurovaceae bacterium]